MDSITPTFSGEVQLAGWSESHSGGCKVTFWLQDSSDLDAFRAMTVRKGNTAGQRLACVLVEIGEDELPVQPPIPSNSAELEKPKAPHVGPIGYWLVLRCKEPEFRAWLTEVGDFAAPLTEQAARDVVCTWCGVESRKDIDGNPEAEAKFQKLIRGPWAKRHMAVHA